MPTTSSATASCARRASSLKELHEDPDRLRDADASGARRHVRADLVGRGVRADRRAARRDPRRRRPRRGRRLPRQPVRARPVAADLRQGARSRRWAPSNIFSASTVDQYPKQLASALMFGGGLDSRDPRPRPHALPAVPGREPAGLQRLADDRARRARPAAGIQARGGRIVVVDPRRSAHRAGRRRAPLHPPGHRRPAAGGDRQHAVRRGPGSSSAPRPDTSTGSTRCGRAARRSRPRRSAPATGIDADDDPPPRPRARGAPSRPRSTGGSGRRRSPSARSPAG